MELIAILFLVASPLWLPPVVFAARSKGIRTWERFAAILLALVSPLAFAICFAAVYEYCSTGAQPSQGFVGTHWPQCPDAGLPWLAIFAPATLIGLASWIISGVGSSRPEHQRPSSSPVRGTIGREDERRGDRWYVGGAAGVFLALGLGIALLGFTLAVAVVGVSSARRDDALLKIEARREAAMAASQEDREQELAEARETCAPLPASLATAIVGGLHDHIPGEMQGQPGKLLPFDQVTLTAYVSGPDEHIIEVRGRTGNSNVLYPLVVSGPLEAPNGIGWLTNSLGSQVVPNPTEFRLVVREDWPTAPWLCDSVGATSGPYRTAELASIDDT